jgi:arginase
VKAAGLIRVPRAWGAGGAPMEAAAEMPLDFDEVATVRTDDLDEQHEQIAAALPEWPVVLGGCCCAHVGAARGLARRHGRIAVIWLDAHGDLNTAETSPSGNEWGMPYRMLLDARDVAPADAALFGSRNLDPPEQDFIERVGLATDCARIGSVLEGVTGAYLAVDCDVFDPGEIRCFMPEPHGATVSEVASLIAEVRARTPILGMGFTGLVAAADNVGTLDRLACAAGFNGHRTAGRPKGR